MCWLRLPTPPPATRSRRWTRPRGASRVGGDAAARARRDPALGFETLIARADDLATLMTLEMGKVVAESMGEVKYGAEFFRWFAEEAVRIGGRFIPGPAGDRPHHRHQAARRPVLRDHPVELPAGHGHPQDRARDGRRLHDDRQARTGDAAEHAAAGQADGPRPACRGRAVGAADQPRRVRSPPR